MGLSGLIGAGAQGGLEELLTRQLLEQQQAERERAQRAQEAAQSRQMDQQASRDSDLMAHYGRQDARAEKSDREESNRAGVADMERQRGQMDKQEALAQLREELAKFEADPSIPSRVKAQGRAGRLGITGTSDEDFASSEERDAEGTRKAGQVGAEAEARAKAEAKYRAPKEAPQTGVAGMSAVQLSTAKQFQDDYARDSKTYTTVRNAYQQVAGAATNPDAAGDLSLIFGYMKMLDPNSVVRETEFANAQNAAGVPDQVRNLWNRAMKGERLNPNQRQQFVGQAKRLWTSAHGNQGRVRKTYNDRATKFAIDPSMVLDDEEPLDDAPSVGTVKMQAPTGQIQDVPADQVDAFKAKGAKVVP